VAQACFMGFKSDHMKEFFLEWEAIWREWITPVPFVRYADPFPSFPGSAFCIEQYALGMAIEKLVPNLDEAVMIIPRSQMILAPTGTSGNLRNGTHNLSNEIPRSDPQLDGSSMGALALLLGNSSSYGSSGVSSYLTSALSSALSSFYLLGSTSYSTSYDTSYLTSAGVESSALSSMFSSYGLEVLSSYFSNLSTSHESSMRSFLETSYGSSFFSSYASSYATSYDTSYSTSYASSYASSYDTSYFGSYATELTSSYASALGSTSYPSTSYNSSAASSSYTGLQFGGDSSSNPFGVNSSAFGIDLTRYRMVDNFAGNVLHYYSANYEIFKS